MERGFASYQTLQMSLNKMTPNQPMVVKRIRPPERLKCSKSQIFNGLAFEQKRVNQPVSFEQSGWIGPWHVHKNRPVHVAVNIDP